MSNKRWILYVLGISLLVPFLLEGWTVYTMVLQTFDGSTEVEQRPPGTKTYYGEGDELLPSTEATERLTRMVISKPGNRWVFYLSIDIKNSSDQRYEFTLRNIVLQDGTPIRVDQSRVFDPNEEGTFEVELELPSGTIPRVLRVGTRTKDQSEFSVSEIPLASVPVRKEGP